ncbi:MAG: YidC/Oxa1 family membrane protein insertase, partial [Lachnospiraceae bacterium]|nr:YidC/Oxa1 family membrane protein insertase [Lachnospiraceae bacterium]
MGYIVYFAYRLTGSYGAAIIIFAFFARIILFPVSIATHKNSIRLLQIGPSLHRIKQRCAGDKKQLNEAQYELFQKEKYSPLVGLVPLFVQLFLIIGILQVMYNPLQHILHMEKPAIDALLETTRELNGTQGGYGEQLLVFEAINQAENIPAYQAALADFPNRQDILRAIAETNLYFMGINLGVVPTAAFHFPVSVVPFLSGLAALLLCLAQTALSPGALSQGRGTNWGLTVFTVALSAYFAAVTPAGVGIYWTVKSLLGIAVLPILNLMYNPKKLAKEALEYMETTRKTPEQLGQERARDKALRAREKTDAARFNKAPKQLVFYAISSGQYKFYKNIIEYLLAHSDIAIHYLTNDPDDAVFQKNEARLLPYYVSQKRTALLLLKLDTDLMVTTVPDLHSSYIKRSVARDDIEYIFTPHALIGSHITAREQAFDYFDTFFCVGPHRIPDLRWREKTAGLKKKNLVKAGYGVYDQLVESCASLANTPNERPQILIAPSWQADNIMELCIGEILEALTGKGYRIVVRPHPQEMRLFPERKAALEGRFADYAATGEIVFEFDFSGNESIFMSDILITDWSNIAFEFAFC